MHPDRSQVMDVKEHRTPRRLDRCRVMFPPHLRPTVGEIRRGTEIGTALSLSFLFPAFFPSSLSTLFCWRSCLCYISFFLFLSYYYYAAIVNFFFRKAAPADEYRRRLCIDLSRLTASELRSNLFFFLLLSFIFFERRYRPYCWYDESSQLVFPRSLLRFTHKTHRKKCVLFVKSAPAFGLSLDTLSVCTSDRWRSDV